MDRSVEMIIPPRAHDLGGFSVRRILPYAKRKMVGPFIFFDHLGPATFVPGEGIDVRAHPHIGLATVTYLFEGALHHKDTVGSDITIRPGAVNWMTAGRGIVHSERTPSAERTAGHTIHAIQTWVALPETEEECAPNFTHHPSDTLPEFDLGGARAKLLAGSAWGHESPVAFPWGIWYLAIETEGPAAFDIPANAAHERALYLCNGGAHIGATKLSAGEMAVLTPQETASIRLTPGSRLMMAGGETMDKPRNIAWNLVSTDKTRIDKAFADWETSIDNSFKGTYFTLPPGETDWIPTPKR